MMPKFQFGNVGRLTKVPLRPAKSYHFRCNYDTLRKPTIATFATRTRPAQQQTTLQNEARGDNPYGSSPNDTTSSRQKTQLGEGPSDQFSATGIVSNWVHQASLEEIPLRIIQRAKYIILDGIACALTAAQLPESRVAANSIFGMESPGACTVIGWNKRLGPLPAALLNSTFIQGFEIDDVHQDAPWHANSIILPALLAAVEHCPSPDSVDAIHTGKSLLVSAIVGFELGGRIGRSLSGKEMLSRGWHSGAVFGPAAAAAAVARQIGLSPRQIEDAVGTAATQACGLMSAQYEAMAKRMQHGFAARNGLFAALTAKDNYTGIDKVFERPYGGFISVFSQGSSAGDDLNSRAESLTRDLGSNWTALEGICPKPYASMVGTHGAIDCVAALQNKEAEKCRDLSSTRHIKIELNKSWFHHSGQDIDRPVTVIGAQMSTKYCVAAQLVDRDVLAQQFSSDKLNREEIWNLVDKTTCEHNEDFDKEPKGCPTRLTIEFEDGSVLSESTKKPSTTANPMSNEDVLKKWTALVESCIDRGRMRRIEDMILSLEDVRDVRELIQELTLETRSPLS